MNNQLTSVVKCKISYKISKTCLNYNVTPQLISDIRILFVEFLHRTLKHNYTHNWTHRIKYTQLDTQFETQSGPHIYTHIFRHTKLDTQIGHIKLFTHKQARTFRHTKLNTHTHTHTNMDTIN